MRPGHLEAFRPVCPHCRSARQTEVPLRLAAVFSEQGEHVIQGMLLCSDAACSLEYPIIDGVPIIVPQVREYLADHLVHIAARDDLCAPIESILGDAVGAGTVLDSTRQYLSAYGWDHYADLDPGVRPDAASPGGGLLGCLETALGLLGDAAAAIDGPVLDLGCSVGRSSFELARRLNVPVLGIEVNFSMLRVAQRVLREGRVCYPLRRTGVVYDRQDYAVDLPSDQVDFWACDAQALPLPHHAHALATAFNLLDSVGSPLALLQSLAAALKPGGWGLLGTPYDWSAAVTPIENWVGGHSQRGTFDGNGEAVLRHLLTPADDGQPGLGLALRGEVTNHPWAVRQHARSTTSYLTHLVAVQAAAAAP